MPEVPINYLAILVCGVVAIVIGFVWYGPLFGKQWMKMAGFDTLPPEKMAEGKKKMPIMAAIQFIGALVMAGVFEHVLAFANAYFSESGWMSGVEGALWLWAGFVAPVTVGMVLWEGRPWKYWFIVAGNWLATLVAMGAIIGAWS